MSVSFNGRIRPAGQFKWRPSSTATRTTAFFYNGSPFEAPTYDLSSFLSPGASLVPFVGIFSQFGQIIRVRVHFSSVSYLPSGYQPWDTEEGVLASDVVHASNYTLTGETDLGCTGSSNTEMVKVSAKSFKTGGKRYFEIELLQKPTNHVFHINPGLANRRMSGNYTSSRSSLPGYSDTNGFMGHFYRSTGENNTLNYYAYGGVWQQVALTPISMANIAVGGRIGIAVDW